MSIRTKQWTREEYDRLIEVGGFPPGSRVQLVQGEIVEMPSQKPAHATAILLAGKTLERVFARGFTVRTQLPLALGEWSEPDPDVAVVPGAIADYRNAHPQQAVLVVEVADSTLEFDRTRRLQVYAEAGVPEYWIVNLIERRVEVYRHPEGRRYQESRRAGPDEVIAPAGAPAESIRVSDLLP